MAAGRMCVAMCGGHSIVGRLGGLGLCVVALLVRCDRLVIENNGRAPEHRRSRFTAVSAGGIRGGGTLARRADGETHAHMR